MTLGDKLSQLRKENNYTQEQMADILSISRQSVSKWESDSTYPETEKLIRMSKMYHCSLDYLLNDELNTNTISGNNNFQPLFSFHNKYFERKSKRTIAGVPLWHVNFGLHRTAKGIIAIGIKSKGILSIGIFSIGIISLGYFSLGLLSLGLFALGILSAGCIAAGVIVAGAISIGVISLGALAIGEFSVGALAIGRYAAIGDHAQAAIALGDTVATGHLFSKIGELTLAEILEVKKY